MDMYSLVMISAVNGSSVAETQLHSITATWNMFYDRSMDGCVLLVMTSAMNGCSVAEQ